MQEYFLKANGEAEWARLEAALDMSLDEWIGQRELAEEVQGDGDEEEEEGELQQGEDDEGEEEDEDEGVGQ